MKIKSMLVIFPVVCLSVASYGEELLTKKTTQSTQVKVKSGDTLWSIAYRYRPDTDIPMARMMQAIYARNPDAFYNKQLTSLKAGAQLTIPYDLDSQVPQSAPLIVRAEQGKSKNLMALTSPQSLPANTSEQIVSNTSPNKVPTTVLQETPIVDNGTAIDADNLVVDGALGIEGRYFPQSAAFYKQSDTQWSGKLELDFYLPWNDEYDAVSFTPFYRKDSEDPHRTHGDIRELKYLHVADEWEIHLGIDRVFWGVTETQHLVDIVNQTDFVEAPDGEDKLGQPMVHLSTLHDWGTLDFFVLPYFRERTYPWWQGRLRGPIPVNTDEARYESDHEQQHIDYAVRWNHFFSDWEVALSGFKGTSREPMLVAQTDELGEPELAPFYPQISQLGLETLYLSGSWIWKLEAIHREGKLIENYRAADIGFEYTLYGLGESVIDLGLLMEFQYDSRGASAAIGQKDLFFGTRLAFNDVDGSEILAGIAQDLDFSDSRSLLIEAKTRLSPHWTANLDLWLFSSEQPQDLNYLIRQDDFVQLGFELHF